MPKGIVTLLLPAFMVCFVASASTTDGKTSPAHSKKEKSKDTERTVIADNGGRGPGGGGYDCLDPSTGERFMFSIDYALSREKPGIEHDFGANASCTSILRAIENRLATTNPAMAVGLSRFINGLDQSKWVSQYQLTDETSHLPQLWIKKCEASAPMGCLEPIFDDHTEKAVPPGCKRVQIAERVQWQNPQQTLFYVDFKAVNELKKDPLQCSHFFIHEWARDFVEDSEKIRKIDHLLHSEAFFTSKELLTIDGVPAIGQGLDCVKESSQVKGDTNLLNIVDRFAYYRDKIVNPWSARFSKPPESKPQGAKITYEVFPSDISPMALLKLIRDRQSAGAIHSFAVKHGDKNWLITVLPAPNPVK